MLIDYVYLSRKNTEGSKTMLLINILGLLLIGLIIWWFWLYQPKAVVSKSNRLTVILENGIYQPSRIQTLANQPVSIDFLRKDPSPCAASLIFPDFDLNEELPLNKNKTISLPAMSKGEYGFHCQMKMYNGYLLVE
jgi:plastocyanin domain-containing protein